MLPIGFIETVETYWASPLVFVVKKDGALRVYGDSCKMNEVTIWDLYPIARMYKCIDLLGDTTTFSILDANSGYWQVEMAEED